MGSIRNSIKLALETTFEELGFPNRIHFLRSVIPGPSAKHVPKPGGGVFIDL